MLTQTHNVIYQGKKPAVQGLETCPGPIAPLLENANEVASLGPHGGVVALREAVKGIQGSLLIHRQEHANDVRVQLPVNVAS